MKFDAPQPMKTIPRKQSYWRFIFTTVGQGKGQRAAELRNQRNRANTSFDALTFVDLPTRIVFFVATQQI